LLAAAASGSHVAFSALVDANQQKVRNFARRLAAMEGDDLAQEAFAVAWMRLAQFDQRSRFSVWVCGIVFRLHKSWRRSLMRARARDGAWLGLQDECAALQARDLFASHAVRKAFAALTSEERACVALCLVEGFSHSEAARALNLPLGSVKSHIARGRARLAVLLGGVDDER
jgi:RNA polymerase sigma-70 factor (ECF subfamily)